MPELKPITEVVGKGEPMKTFIEKLNGVLGDPAEPIEDISNAATGDQIMTAVNGILEVLRTKGLVAEGEE